MHLQDHRDHPHGGSLRTEESKLATQIFIPEGDSVPLLTPAERKRKRPYAVIAVISAMLFSGIAIAATVGLMYKHPASPLPGKGQIPDLIIRAGTVVTVLSLVVVVIKTPPVWLFAGMLERGLGRVGRDTRIRAVFNKDIRGAAFWGGALQTAYSLSFLMASPFVAPVALTSARAAGVLAVAIVELLFGVLIPAGRWWWLRLVGSIAITLVGAGTVIMAGGFDLSPGEDDSYLWLFLLVITVGNVVLAFAELMEFRGVHKRVTAAAIYTLARFVYYAITSITMLVVLATWWGKFHIIWGALQMCADRWLLILAMAFFWGLTDLVRMCSKAVLAATFMYVVMSGTPMVDFVAQTAAHHHWPKIFHNVHSGPEYFRLVVIGAIIVVIGACFWPHEKVDETSAAK